MNKPVSDDMFAKIKEELRQIDRRENIQMLLAVESGSRAWGFHSPDSDYDVRFIYTRPPEWHYRLGKRRDVVEYPIDTELDLSGWELRKALELMLGSNAVVGEWLQSPIVYAQNTDAVAELRGFADRCLNRRSTTWHYLSLADRQLSRLLTPEGGVRLKRFFYILRPVLSMRWMRLHSRAMAPMNMTELRRDCALSFAEETALTTLTEQKMLVQERAEIARRDPTLDRLVESELHLAREWLEQTSAGPRSQLEEEANALHLALSPR